MLKTTRFYAADLLDTEHKQAAYITAALETGDAAFVRDALGIVAKARGMGQVAKIADLNREGLYKRSASWIGFVSKNNFNKLRQYFASRHQSDGALERLARKP